MRRHRVEGGDAASSQRATDFPDLIGLAVERAADHQERSGSLQAIQLLDDHLGRRTTEYNLIHGAEYDTALMHACPPRGILALLAALKGRLAEEIQLVMPEDDPAPASSSAMRCHNALIISFIFSASSQRSDSSAPSGPVMA